GPGQAGHPLPGRPGPPPRPGRPLPGQPGPAGGRRRPRVQPGPLLRGAGRRPARTRPVRPGRRPAAGGGRRPAGGPPPRAGAAGVNPCPYGFRILGTTSGDRVVVDAARALSGYAACDPRAQVEREAYLSAFTFGTDFRRLLEDAS